MVQDRREIRVSARLLELCACVGVHARRGVEGIVYIRCQLPAELAVHEPAAFARGGRPLGRILAGTTVDQVDDGRGGNARGEWGPRGCSGAALGVGTRGVDAALLLRRGYMFVIWSFGGVEGNHARQAVGVRWDRGGSPVRR